MATAPTTHPEALLKTGDRMSRAEFHRLYEMTPRKFKAELIGGVVYVASPLRWRHGSHHSLATAVLVAYQAATPSVETGDNATILLGDDSEPQPDLSLRIHPEAGGQSHLSDDGYVVGPPEFVIEIACSSRDVDLHAKRDDYARYGVLEYVVVCVEEQRLAWINLAENREMQPSRDNVIRIQTLPGLWIDGDALLAGDAAQLLATLQTGLATPEHAAFVQRLNEQRIQRQ